VCDRDGERESVCTGQRRAAQRSPQTQPPPRLSRSGLWSHFGRWSNLKCGLCNPRARRRPRAPHPSPPVRMEKIFTSCSDGKVSVAFSNPCADGVEEGGGHQNVRCLRPQTLEQVEASVSRVLWCRVPSVGVWFER